MITEYGWAWSDSVYCIFSVSVSIGDARFNHSELAPTENVCMVHFEKYESQN